MDNLHSIMDIFSVVSAQIDCSINPFLPPVEELHNFIEHLEATEIDVILKEGKLYLSGSWNSIAFIRATLSDLVRENEEKEKKHTEDANEKKLIASKNLQISSSTNSLLDSIHENGLSNEDDINEDVAKSSEDNQSDDEDCINIEVFHSESSSKSDKKNLKFSCSLCSFQSQRKSHFAKHTALHQTMTTIYRCEECTFSTLRFTHLRRHQVTHSMKPLACSSCNYSTDDSKLLARHTRLQHKMPSSSDESELKVRQCPACPYTTTRLYLYERHMKVHSAEESKGGPNLFICSQCDYRTSRKIHYVRHVRDVHRQCRPYLCHNCGKAFKRPDALKQHSLLHSTPGTAAFQCRLCDKICHSNAHLKEHQAVHSSERSFLCEICGASFKTRSVQRKHVATLHQNPRAYPCQLCNKRFNTNYALRRHMKQHPTTAEVDELENNLSSKLVTIVLPSDHHQTGSEEALTLTVKLDQADDSLLYLPEQQSTP